MTTTGPTEIDFFANHTTDTLRKIVEEKTSAAKFMANNGGTALAVDAISIANAAWGQLVLRGHA